MQEPTVTPSQTDVIKTELYAVKDRITALLDKNYIIPFEQESDFKKFLKATQLFNDRLQAKIDNVPFNEISAAGKQIFSGMTPSEPVEKTD